MSEYNNEVNNISTYVSGIEKNDIIYIISDISKLLIYCRKNHISFNPTEFINSILEKIGPSGTVLFPTFNWNFRDGYKYDYTKSLSSMGGLTRYAQRRNDFVRTLHPIHSFAVCGKYQKYLTNIDPKNSFGDGTIFDFMYRQKAKAIAFGLNCMEGMTFIHHVEKMVGVPFRKDKEYSGVYVDKHGEELHKTYSMYAIDNDNFDVKKINRFRKFGKIAEKEGVAVTKETIAGPCSLIDLAQLYDLIESEIKDTNMRNLYVYRKR